MGLDMYLEKSTYIGAYYPHRKITGLIGLAENEVPIPIKLERVSEITEQIGYWRKADAIHNWFVQNCADGVDDCKPVFVTRNQLETLLALVREAMENKTEFHPGLPTITGFFFGETDDLEWYHNDLAKTERILVEALQEPDNCEFIYRASW